MARERKFSTAELYQATKELLLKRGYEGFSFSLLARKLDVSRGAIYKYYGNKDELLSEYMVVEMEHFIGRLQRINEHPSFNNQLDFLLDIILEDQEIHRLREYGFQIPHSTNKMIKKNKEKLNQLHLDMYRNLAGFVQLGKKENIIKASLPESLVLGYVFQAIDIPNHEFIPQEKWIALIKEIICHGIFTEK